MAWPSPFRFFRSCVQSWNVALSPKLPSKYQAMKTARLILRELRTDDAGRIAALGGDWDVASMTGRIPFPYSEHAALQWVSGLADGEVVYGIECAGELIGICGYSPADDGSAELGYWIGKPYWGAGYASEAAELLMRHGFSKGGIKRFTCCHFSDNSRSARVASKLGFRALGPCTGWSEARQEHLPTVTYERRRPWTTLLKALAS
jgi:[ribosomal protein S5]-alanine N-acetyltransferase